MTKKTDNPQVDERKISIYLAEDILREVRSQAKRLDRTISWLLRYAWTVAKPQVDKLQSPNVTVERGVTK